MGFCDQPRWCLSTVCLELSLSERHLYLGFHSFQNLESHFHCYCVDFTNFQPKHTSEKKTWPFSQMSGRGGVKLWSFKTPKEHPPNIRVIWDPCWTCRRSSLLLSLLLLCHNLRKHTLWYWPLNVWLYIYEYISLLAATNRITLFMMTFP